MGIAEYWKKFLSETGRNPDETGFSGEMVFEGEGVVGFQRLSLVLSGKRTASFSAFESYALNREMIPVSGELYIVENLDGEPCAILELTNVSVIPFYEIPWDLARRDGESATLDEWREKMRESLEDEGALCGFDVDEKTRVVCEIFRVIFQ